MCCSAVGWRGSWGELLEGISGGDFSDLDWRKASTVAILAQGTSWAVAVTQAFFVFGDCPCPFSQVNHANQVDQADLIHQGNRADRAGEKVVLEKCGRRFRHNL